MKNLLTKITLILVTPAILSSCDAIKKVSENDLLLTQNILLVDTKASKDAGAISQILQEPNTLLLGIPVALHFYNLASEKNDSIYYAQLYKTPKKKQRLINIFSQKQVDEWVNYKTGFNNWIKKTGEAPVIIKKDRAIRSKERIEEYYKSLGWLNAEASYQIIADSLKEKRGKVVYSVDRKKPYSIDSIIKKIDSPVVDSIFKTQQNKSYLKSGQQYRATTFANERDRVTRLMRNSGLFNFNQEYISFIADTVNTGHKANIEYFIKNQKTQVGNTTQETPFKVHKISKINVVTDYNYENRNKTYKDSILYKGYTIYGIDKIDFKPQALTNAIFINPNSIYKDTDRNLTYNHLNELNIFRYPTITYEQDPKDTTQTHLITTILLNPKKKFGMNFEIDASRSNIQEFGLGFSMGFLVRNIFKGAEILEISGRGSLGSSRDVAERDNQFFNISELGGDIKLAIPRILFPLNTQKIVPKYMSPATNITLRGTSQKNIGLDKQTTNLIWNYNWKPSNMHALSLDLFNLEFVRNLNTENYFNVYKNSFDRLNSIALDSNAPTSYFNLDDNNNPIALTVPQGTSNFINDFSQGLLTDFTAEDTQTLRNIIQQQNRLTENNLIVASNISWIRDSRKSIFDNQFSRTRLKLELAGNLLATIASLAEIEKNENDTYDLFNVNFSQYVKVESEYIRYWELNKNSQLTMRLFGGIAVPYGNSNNIPFTRSYFAGGPNDNRGWLPYELGPGSSNNGDQFNEANLKLAANLEYRFTLLSDIKGALFIDAGNIWNTLDDVTDAPSTFTTLTDLEDTALASGFGLRYDLGFFVLRADLGFKTYNPSKPLGQRWFKEYNFSNTILNIGINYPF